MSSGLEQAPAWPRETQRDVATRDAARRRWAQGALALGLFGAGLFQGYRWAPEAPVSPVVYEAGALVATGELEQVLYDPALGGREEGPSVGEAFTNKSGHSCRTFTDGRVSGVACERSGDWRVVELRQQ
jgi:hypothetical protein